MCRFGMKMARRHLWIHFKDLVEILHNERGQEVHENLFNGFLKNTILVKWVILVPKMV